MGEFLYGLIIGILGTGLFCGIYFAYLFGKNASKENSYKKENAVDKVNKREKKIKKKKKQISTDFSGDNGMVQKANLTVNGNTKLKKKNNF